jgi:hypothetical protein
MSDHPLKMKDKLLGKKRPTSKCRIFIGDQTEFDEVNQEAVKSLLESIKGYQNELSAEMRETIIRVAKEFTAKQEPFFTTFVFRAMKPVEYEKLTEVEEYRPRPGTDDIAFNYDTFPVAVFRQCLIEPAYDTLSDEEWDEFLDNCSQTERRLLLDTSLTCNQRNIEPSTPKDLMTR